jgi:LacI family transcriptional regulator
VQGNKAGMRKTVEAKQRSRVVLADVAKLAGVHPATASHALSHRAEARLSQETREKVLSAARQLGYAPNLAARALATGRTNLFAVLTFDFHNSYAVEITRLIHKLAAKEGASVISSIVDSDLGGVAAHVDGVIALDYSPKMKRQDSFGAYVALGVFAPEDRDCCLIDFKPAAEEAMKHLISNGRKEILYVTGEDPLHDDDPRELVYKEAMTAAGLKPRILTLPAGDRESAYLGLTKWLKSHKSDAVFCRNDSLALGCLKALNEAGIQTPAETAVVGCDGSPDSNYTLPTLSTLVVPFESACEAAWQMLRDRLANPDSPPQRKTFTAQFQRRGTS